MQHPSIPRVVFSFWSPDRWSQVQIPDFQRPEDQLHLQCIIDDWLAKLNTKSWLPLGIITVAMRLDGTNVIVDGQHRVAAIRHIALHHPEHLPTMDYPVCRIACQEPDEEYELFDKINRNKPVPLAASQRETGCRFEIERFFRGEYKPFLKESQRPRPPHLSLLGLRNALDQVVFPPEWTGEGMRDLLSQWDRFFLNRSVHEWSQWNVSPEHLEKCRNAHGQPCFFSLFKEHEWLYRMIDDPNPANHDHTPLWCMPRKPIPKKRRIHVWERDCGNSLYGQCAACKQPVSHEHWEIGHRKARCRGGSDEVDNLLVLCKTCNRDMGIRHVDEYMSLLV